MIKRLRVFDFDGTLVDSTHRYRTQSCGTKIDLQYWIDNEYRTLDDSLLPLVGLYREFVKSPEDYVIIATARIWCGLSAQFVIENDLTPQIVFARKDRNDIRGGAQLKIQGIKRLLNLKQFQNVEKIHVYEDNISYLNTLCMAFKNSEGHFYPSKQGH